MLMLLHFLINLVYGQIPKCYLFDFQNCASNTQCLWISWQPSLCHNDCYQIDNQNDCSQAQQCYWDLADDFCGFLSCVMPEKEEICYLIAACEWKDNQCYDQSCIRLQAQESGQCPTNYCIWNENRKLCYDKKCQDYFNQVDCLDLSFCEWQQYSCIEIKDAVMIQY